MPEVPGGPQVAVDRQVGGVPMDEWARFDATTRACVISSFQQCLPDEVEQEVLREAFLDVTGARKWARQVG